MTLYEPRSIDLHPAANGAYKTQEQWIEYFDRLGRAMISAADVYQAGKSAPGEVLQSLRDDSNLSWLVSSTRISRYGDDLSGRITQNYGSKVVTPFQTDVLIIPVYNEMSLAQALQNEDGVSYIQALFDTSDKPQDIIRALEGLSGKGAKEIRLWTPEQGSRKRDSEMAVMFSGGGGSFRVGGGGRFGSLSSLGGQSYGCQ